MQEHEFSNQIQWLAFCYIADELDDEQRIAFEKQLADDQDARDAVVQAMEQSQLMLAALNEAKLVPSGRRTRLLSRQYSPKLASRLLAFAATLLLMTTGLIWLANSDYLNSYHPPVAKFQSTSFDADLASAWAESFSDVSAADFEYSSDKESGDGGLTETVFEGAEDWMLSALEEMETADDSNRSDEEN